MYDALGERESEGMTLISLGNAYGHVGVASCTVTYSKQTLCIAHGIA